eukprot:GHVR01147261.1.p1 GENE.GHVR01147261.1~~GHVR01147261.1.p1  ORF type:complete len:249 (+),score=53.96 GHVR01147261.1:173-919(+)
MTVNGEGNIQHWHVSSNKMLSEISLPGNQLYACDYCTDGSMFAVSGMRTEVFLFDDNTKTEIVKMTRGDDRNCSGHSNRIYALKCFPDNNKLVITGGWDNTVQVWDSRVGHSVKSLPNVEIRGDAIDVSNDGKTLLTGVHRSRNPLQLWDFGTMKPTGSIGWKTKEGSTCPDTACTLYAAQFSKDSQNTLVAAGGGNGGRNEAAVFDRRCENAAVGLITSMAKPCFSVDFSPDGGSWRCRQYSQGDGY